MNPGTLKHLRRPRRRDGWSTRVDQYNEKFAPTVYSALREIPEATHRQQSTSVSFSWRIAARLDADNVNTDQGSKQHNIVVLSYE